MPELFQKLMEWKSQGAWGLGAAPDWLLAIIASLIPITLIILVFALIFAYTTLFERKILARVQNRYGPNRVGPCGLLQPIADGVKMLIKEDIVPRRADKLLHLIGPVAMCAAVLLLYAVLPYGKGVVPVDLDIGVLFIFAVGSASTLAMFMAGWSSRNKYSLLGAMRGVAQMVSYELPLVLSVVVVIMIAGTLQTTKIVEAQTGPIWNWFVFTPWGLAGFAIYIMASMAESTRSPFDLPEAESELIAGYHTEYSGFKWAVIQMAEYFSTIVMSGLAVTLFLGGWSGPGVNIPFWGSLLSFFYFFVKLIAVVLFMIWCRATWPRIRVDQLMGFAWKALLPLALFNIFAAAVWYYLGPKAIQTAEAAGRSAGAMPYIISWLVCAVLLAIAYLTVSRMTAKTAIEKRRYRYV